MSNIRYKFTSTHNSAIKIDNHTLSNHIYANRQERTAAPIITTDADGARAILVASNGGAVSRFTYDVSSTTWLSGNSVWKATQTIGQSVGFICFNCSYYIMFRSK